MDAVVEGGEPLVFFDGRFQNLEKALARPMII